MKVDYIGLKKEKLLEVLADGGEPLEERIANAIVENNKEILKVIDIDLINQLKELEKRLKRGF